MKLILVVRRFGPVGGMERYVWELSREFNLLGHQVTVLCERCHVERPSGIEVHELGEIAMRPRWLALLRFGARVNDWLKAHPHPGWLIHSHERLGVHHVTTFHGPPFATVFEKPFWQLISLRVLMRLYLDRRELIVAQAIVPNSQFIKQQLVHYYPEQKPKMTEPIVPGVLKGPLRPWKLVPSDGGIIGFVGYEWQRKGLPRAVEIAAQLKQSRPNLEIWVVGPTPNQVQHLFENWKGGYKLLGWCENSEYLSKIDMLLHPAIAEPYGMVISEAMAACVPVVISDICGAAVHVMPDSGAVLPLSASLEMWISAIEQQLNRSEPVPQFARGWREVAQEYEKIYQMINNVTHI